MELDIEQQEILSAIEKIWKSNPNLRFLQLIGNCTGPISLGDIYYVENIEFLSELKNTYSHYLP